MSRSIRKIVSMAMVLSMLLTLTPATASVWDRDAWLSGSVAEDHAGHDHDEESLVLHDHDDDEDLDAHEYTEEELAALEAELLLLVTDDPLGAGPVADAPADEPAEEPEAEPVAELPKAEVSEPAAKPEATAQDDENSGADDAGAEVPVMIFTVENDEDSGAADAKAETPVMIFTVEDDEDSGAADAGAKASAWTFTVEDDEGGGVGAVAAGIHAGSQGANGAAECLHPSTTPAVKGKQSTCTEEGYKKDAPICDVCGELTDDNYKTVMKNHQYDKDAEPLNVEKANCQSPQMNTYQCKDCDATKAFGVGNKSSHDFDEKYGFERVEATCSKKGHIYSKCQWYDLCGRTWDTVLDKAAHTPDYDNVKKYTVNPTCAAPGFGNVYCAGDGCNTLLKDVEIPGGHIEKTVTEALAPTCKDAGHTAQVVCSRCGETLQESEELPRIGGNHNWVEGVVYPEATCTEPGWRNLTCSKCGATDTKKIKKLGHSYDYTQVPLKVHLKPKCTSNGIGMLTCVTCQEDIPGVVLPKLEHNYQPAPDVPATCTAEGYELEICKNDKCGAERPGAVLPMVEHYYGWVAKTYATCTTEGEEVELCSECPKTRRTNPIKALGHDYKLTETKAATQAEAGYKKYECQTADCTGTYQEVLPKLEGTAAPAAATATTSAKTTTAASRTSHSNNSYATEEFEDYEMPLAGFNSQLGAVDSLTLDTLNQLLDTASLQEILQALLVQDDIRALPLDIGTLPEEGIRLPIIVDKESYLAGYVLIKPSERNGQRGFLWLIEVEDGFSMSNVTLLVAKTLEEINGLETLSSSDDIYSGGGGFVPVNGVVLLSLWSSTNYSEDVATVYQKDQSVRARLDELSIR